jgi:hypothetical protein
MELARVRSVVSARAVPAFLQGDHGERGDYLLKKNLHELHDLPVKKNLGPFASR